MAHEGGACVWRGLVCVSYRCGSECLSDTDLGHKKEILGRTQVTATYGCPHCKKRGRLGATCPIRQLSWLDKTWSGMVGLLKQNLARIQTRIRAAIDSFHISGRPWQPRTLSAIGWPPRTANFVLALSTDECHFVACNSGCLFFLFLLFFMKCNHQHRMGVLGPFPTGREQNRADAEDLVEWCVCTRTWSVDVCMESNHENFPGTESSCPEKKPGKERNSYLCCETYSGFVTISPADSLLRNWQSLTASALPDRTTYMQIMFKVLHSSLTCTQTYTTEPACENCTQKKNMQSTRLKKKNKKLTIEQCKRQKENWLWRVCSPLHTKSTSK